MCILKNVQCKVHTYGTTLQIISTLSQPVSTLEDPKKCDLTTLFWALDYTVLYIEVEEKKFTGTKTLPLKTRLKTLQSMLLDKTTKILRQNS